MANVYLGKAFNLRKATETLNQFLELNSYHRPTGICEVIHWGVQNNPQSRHHLVIREFLSLTLDSAQGVSASPHPTSLISLASVSLTRYGDLEAATRLTCLALQWTQPFWVLDDVARLARLLRDLNAPLFIWSDWCSIFYRHINASFARREAFARNLHDDRARCWAVEEDNDSERVLRETLGFAPRETLELLKRLSLRRKNPEFARILDGFAPGPEPSQPRPPSVPLWHARSTLFFRYNFFFNLVEHEQTFIENGDWALFQGPTRDFSMGLAQWWRTVESVLKRTFVKDLSELFVKNPDWSAWDDANLSRTARRSVEIFFRLTSPEKANRITLRDIWLLLGKCIPPDDSHRGSDGSRLRLEACRYFDAVRRQAEPLVKDDHLNTGVLSVHDIDDFRNRASHDDPIDLVDAAVGRTLARELLNRFLFPAAQSLGYGPHMIVK